MVWDTGTYKAQDSLPPDAQLAHGKIDIVLQGQKLRGGFTLVQTGNVRIIPVKRSAGCSSSTATSMPIRHGILKARA
jgi:hypothetical protein